VRREDVKAQRPSKLSPMPTGLLVTFTREEILDLIAFLQNPAPEPKSEGARSGGSR
jgi:hypothetical protein